MILEITRWYLTELRRNQLMDGLFHLLDKFDKECNVPRYDTLEDTFIIMHRRYYKRIINMPIIFNKPDLSTQEQIHDSVQKFFFDIPPTKIGGVFGVTTRDAQGNMQSNAVIVIKKGDKLEIGGYIGKTWGEKGVVAGVEGKYFF